MPSTTSKLLAQVVPALAPHLVRGLMSTCRYKSVYGDVSEFLERDKPFIGVVWHKDLLFALDFFRRRKKIVVMVSRSKDGEIVARALQRDD